MSEHLKNALDSWMRSTQSKPASAAEISHLRASVCSLILHLEESQPQTASGSSSSPVIVAPEETSDTSTTSYSWCSPASRAGILPPSVQQAILDSYNLRPHPGDPRVEVTLSIRTPRAATPPSGSASSSPAEAVSPLNGVVGVREIHPHRCKACHHEHLDNGKGACSWLECACSRCCPEVNR